VKPPEPASEGHSALKGAFDSAEAAYPHPSSNAQPHVDGEVTELRTQVAALREVMPPHP
jgi:hypothetical protein